MKKYEIKKGDKFKCIKSFNNYGFEYVKGSEYLSESDWTITDKNNIYADWKGNEHDLFLHFEKLRHIQNNKPTHYQTENNIDIIDFCKMYNLNFNRGNVIKYVARAGKKDDEIKDLEKALDFIQREIKYLKEK